MQVEREAEASYPAFHAKRGYERQDQMRLYLISLRLRIKTPLKSQIYCETIS